MSEDPSHENDLCSTYSVVRERRFEGQKECKRGYQCCKWIGMTEPPSI